ncbi:MAG: type II secretion system F family protein [bacterium]
MPLFKYHGNKGDNHKSGSITAISEKAAKDKLEHDGFSSITLASLQSKASIFDHIFNRVSLVQKLFFTQNLEVMVRTGFSLSLALETMSQQVKGKRFKQVIEEVTEDVKSGKTFSSSLEKHADIFSEIFVSMIAAGEASGKLDEVLKRLSIQLKKDHQLIAKVKNALTYPIIVLISMVGIGIAVTIFVIPNLVTVFTESKVELPLLTKILIGFSDLLINYGYILAVVVVLLAIVFVRLLKNPKVHRSIDKLTLVTPIAGTIIKKINLARFTRTLSSLLETDIHIVESFQIISKTMSNSLYRTTMEKAAEELKTGSTISKVLSKQPKLFPPLLLQMVSVGEKSGSLDSISAEIAIFYEEEVDNTMSNLSTIVEPVLMLLLGGAVGLMAVAIIMPIYSLSDAI